MEKQKITDETQKLMRENQRTLETQLEMVRLENETLKSRMQEWSKLAEKTFTQQQVQSAQKGEELANAQGVNKEKKNWQNLIDIEEEMDESTNHQNQKIRNETVKDKNNRE